MILAIGDNARRDARTELISCDFAVVGGGFAGICAAIAAAREGLHVALVQDRPVLGGNASSEVRLWVLGATSHMGNNNRWAREGGIVDEILTENLWRNREGNPVLFDALLMDKVLVEPNIRLLLNTAVDDVELEKSGRIKRVLAFNPQIDTRYFIEAPLFCDASGDGVVAYRAGASYRMGAEDGNEFGEGFAPTKQYGELLGHSMYFYTKKTGQRVNFIPPSFALQDVSVIPRYKDIRPDQWGCNYWWFEYGGLLDTVHDTEIIRQELQKIIYGAWNHIKNSGKYPEADDMTLEWVGVIPGKRESRRFEGLYMLNQNDIVLQRRFEDTVAFGGWAIDLHPAAGVYSTLPSCSQYHSKGIYSIPYRCYVSNNIENLFVAGRLISVSHVAFGSTRVMATAGAGGQAVGVAAALCRKSGCLPADLLQTELMSTLQQKLNMYGQGIPFVPISNSDNLAATASITASSEMKLDNIPSSGRYIRLEYGSAMLLPLEGGIKYTFGLDVVADSETSLNIELRTASRKGNFTPDVLIEQKRMFISKGSSNVEVSFDTAIPEDSYCFLILRPNPKISVAASNERYTGILSVFNKFNLKVNNRGCQEPPQGSGFDSFEFWCPDRRPGGENLSIRITPSLRSFGPDNLINGYVRPTWRPNAWVANPAENTASVRFHWNSQQKVKSVKIFFDNDYDHPLESVQYGHPENVVPFCVRTVRIKDADGKILTGCECNHSSSGEFIFAKPIDTNTLIIEIDKPTEHTPAALFGVYIK